MTYTKQCKLCNEEFEAKSKNTTLCSSCNIKLKRQRTVDSNLRLREQKRLDNNEKYADVVDIPTCLICGWKSTSLQSHLTTHGLTVDQYRKQFNVGNDKVFHSSYIKMKSDRISGGKNPGYQHNGTMSSFSKNSKQYQMLDENEKEDAVKTQIIKANKTKKQNQNYNTTVEFYTKQGFSEQEASDLLSNRQSTFSLKRCIEKYGEIDGTIRWSQRQTKWLNTLDNLPEEEKQRIYKLKQEAIRKAIPFSKISFELFESMGIPDSYYGKHEKTIKLTSGRWISPDFCKGTHIIEFFGDYWHANPSKYTPDFTVVYPGGVKKQAQDIWISDENRVKSLIELGYEVLIIWEKDYRQNKNEVINRCLRFLNS